MTFGQSLFYNVKAIQPTIFNFIKNKVSKNMNNIAPNENQQRQSTLLRPYRLLVGFALLLFIAKILGIDLLMFFGTTIGSFLASWLGLTLSLIHI